MRRPFLLLAILLSLPVVTTAGQAYYDSIRLDPLVPRPTLASDRLESALPDRWFVELAGAPSVEGTDPALLLREQQAFRTAARGTGVRFSERYAFHRLWNGLSVRVAHQDLGRLARLPGVTALFPVRAAAVPKWKRVGEQALANAVAQTGADVVRSQLGFTGAGVRVGVIDSGIDYQHPDLGGGFGPGFRVATGYDLVGDDYDFDAGSTPVPDPDPDDPRGHGTHVAGIIGAAGGVTGVAPGVTFGGYKVFGREGTTGDDVVIAAMERALADGMHVVNISIGFDFEWPQHPTGAAADRLVNRGVVVVASIGNEGESGVYSAGAPGVGRKVIGVASFDNTHQTSPAFTISPDNSRIVYDAASAAPPPPTTGSFEMVRTGTATSTGDACASPLAGNLSGKVALIRRGGCSFYDKAINAQSAGAAAVVVYNNAPGLVSLAVPGSPPVTIPVVAISQDDGELIDSRLASGGVTLTWTAGTVTVPVPTGGLISDFSSYGLAPDLSLKPDLGAPGGFIRSTVPLEQGAYDTLSGSSMSAPHVAGAVALLLQARPRTPSQAVRALLQNTAEPRPWWGNPALGLPDGTHRQGAGMLRIDRAILAGARVEPGGLSLGESEAGPAARTLTVENRRSEVAVYHLTHAPALATAGSTEAPEFFSSPASVAFSASNLVVPAGGTATVGVTIAANPTMPERSQYGGYLVFTREGSGEVIRVPYAGFKGDYQSLPVLVSAGNGFPWLAVKEGDLYFNRPGGETFTLQNGDIPYIGLHLGHQSRRVRFEVREAHTGRQWHRALDLEYLWRDTGDFSSFFPWDGQTTSGGKVYTVPDGDYIVVVSVLKALGDDKNPAHRETWTSPVIRIDRP